MEITGMKIISIDDNANNLKMVEIFARSLSVDVESYSDPIIALQRTKDIQFDLVIVDYMMPILNGISFIQKFREVDKMTPIIMITALGDDDEIHQKALSVGANDFLKKPLNGSLFKLRVTNFLQMRMYQILLSNQARHLEVEVRKATEDILERELEALHIIGKAAEYKDPETGKHNYRVANYSVIVANELGLSEEEQDILYYAAPMHDIGKVGIADHILLKPGPLTEDEWEVMMQHPEIGYNILMNSKSNYLKAGATIAYNHHERYDGAGYPRGIAGKDIPILGRIVAIADVFDALTSKRPYKDAWAFNEAVIEIQELRGNHLDPDIVDAFIKQLVKIKDIYEKI